MNLRKHILDFPSKKEKYWILLWIGEISFNKNQWYVEMYFYNISSTDDKLVENFEKENLKKHVVPVSYLNEYSLGTIYNNRDKKLMDGFSNSYQTVKLNEKISLAKKPFPLLKNNFFSTLIKERSGLEFKYLKLYSFNEKRPGTHILLSPYTLLKFLLPDHDRLIEKALSGNLLDGFDFSSLKIEEDLETGKKVGKIHYDTKCIFKSEAAALSPFLFMQDDIGRKIFKSIYSHLHHIFFNRSKDNNSTYLTVNWEFSKCTFDVSGKSYNLIENGQEKEYLLGYTIENFRFIDKEPFIIDEIILYQYNSKESTPDRKNHEPENIKKKGEPNTKGLSLTLNRDVANSGDTISTTIKGFGNPFKLPVGFKKRDTQQKAYNVKILTNQNKFQSIVRELNNLTSEASDLIENIKKSQISIGNFQYFHSMIKVLSKVIKSKGGNVEQISVRHNQLICEIAELEMNDLFTYIIEFGDGIIGVFNKESGSAISHEDLILTGKKFLRHEEEIENSRKVLWTFIQRKSTENFLKDGIVIQVGVKHQRPSKKDGIITDEVKLIRAAVTATAKIIYYNRIKI